MTYYSENDIYALMQRAPYLRLSNKGLNSLLKETLAGGDAYGQYFAQYPAGRIKPLDFLYQCRYNLDALDEHLLRDLLQATWREANWGAWLALLAPRPEYEALLLEIRGRHPYGQDILELAIAAHSGVVPAHLGEQHSSALRVRTMVESLQRQPRALRKNPGPSQQDAYQAELDAVRAAYRSGGAASALPLTRKGLLGYYGEDYWAWAARQSAPNR